MTAPDPFDRALAEYGLPPDRPAIGFGVPAGAPAASGATRAAAVVGGLALLLLVLTFSLGIAVAAFVGMGVAALVQAQRRRPYTRVAGWLGGVIGTGVALVALVAVAAAFFPRNFSETVRRQMIENARHPQRGTAADTILAHMTPGGVAARDAQTRALTDAVARSDRMLPAIFVLLAIFGCGFWSLVIGSAAWGVGSLLQLGVTGRWPSAGAGSSARLRAPPAPVARDAFDDIR